MIKKFTNNKKGFTLIELMIVIAIIGILAAIAVPQFMTYRMRSYNTAAKTVVHNLKADNPNLNAELGIFGHTEAASAILTATDLIPAPGGGGAAADTFTVPALALSATATAAGARLAGTTFDQARDLSIGMALGRNMVALAINVNNASDLSSYHAFARHYKGDTAYAIDNDVENVLCSVSNPTWANAAGIGATTTPLPTIAPADDINAIGAGGAPTLAWTRVR